MSVLDLIMRHNAYRNSVINMQASENILSPNVKLAMSSDLGSRYSLEINGDNIYGGTRYMEEIYTETHENIKKLFKSEYAEARPLSGHIAAEISILSILNKRKIMAIPEDNGGYPGYFGGNLDRILNFKSVPVPMEGYKINYDELENVASSEKPDAIILGQSVFIRHYDLKRIREICDKYEIKLLYDASHVLGLIAGGAFQDDAMKYSDILYGSTHKTFFGPQGGIIMTNDNKLFDKIEENSIFKTFDNFNLSRFAGLSIAVEEMLKFGQEYAGNVVKNTRNLARSMAKNGDMIQPGTEDTETHQIILNENYLKIHGFNFITFSEEMEKSKIIIDRVGRVGTQEITRYNISCMDSISNIFYGISNKLNMSNEINNIIDKMSLKYW
ncbi:DegT/DnrJ/EryC1/StrS family aminotransferase [Acidiplasma sp.]|uniref:DegT/DnrJ/EryC1/StrS family aminotransferase n=1 Tax=Acidiplasma sp. TaxID=1872114 RepID=UPI002588BDE0|nr:DegT/DnrJ/EryC1/StrS family aminotransferase [Acidiplasma sp.]